MIDQAARLGGDLLKSDPLDGNNDDFHRAKCRSFMRARRRQGFVEANGPSSPFEIPGSALPELHLEGLGIRWIKRVVFLPMILN